jgi:hypothetical protein
MPTPVSATDTSARPLVQRGPDVDPTPLGRELQGVGEEVQEDLLDLPLVGN